tara:strand:+ start:16 stop:201 length:186 start_codon:yes stop_codon:yes gene_type:complete
MNIRFGFTAIPDWINPQELQKNNSSGKTGSFVPNCSLVTKFRGGGCVPKSKNLVKLSLEHI